MGLRLATAFARAETERRRALVRAACVLGLTVWAAQFTAMLAAAAPVALTYLALPTLLSFLVCVAGAGCALQIAGGGKPTSVRLAAASGALGIGIGAAHLMGVMALVGASISPGFAAAGLVIAIALCAPALHLALRRKEGPPISAALAFAGAVAAMHFVGMAGVTLAPHPAALNGPALSAGGLAIIVTIVIFGIFGGFWLSLVPDAAETVIEAAAPKPLPAKTETVTIASNAAAPSSEPVQRRGIYAPLGGAGAPPPRPAAHLPVVRDGATHFLPVAELVAVQANAHYTYLFDGSSKLFCPLAIGEVESRLDRGRFMRVHRSHIVNIERVAGFRRSGDNELVELTADERYVVPVSRSRTGSLKARIGEKTGDVSAQT
jgi:NO-binding membrane sensor protein with MHYT domain